MLTAVTSDNNNSTEEISQNRLVDENKWADKSAIVKTSKRSGRMVSEPIRMRSPRLADRSSGTSEIELDRELKEQIKAEARKVRSAENPELTRAMVRRCKVWAARAKLNVALHKGGKHAQSDGNVTKFNESFKKNFGVATDDSSDDFMHEIGNPTMNPNEFSAPNSFPTERVPGEFKVDNPTKRGCIMRYWVIFYTYCLKFSLSISGALLFGALCGIFYLADIQINDVSMGEVFAAVAGSFLVYIPAGLLEDLFFVITGLICRVIPFVRNFEFLLRTLELKIRIIAVVLACLIALTHIDGLFGSKQDDVLDIFVVGAGVWVVFDLILEGLMHRWNVRAHLAKLNEVICSEAIVRHICKPAVAPEELKVDNTTWRTFTFKKLTRRSAFYHFDQILRYVMDSPMLVPLKRKSIGVPPKNFLSYDYSHKTFVAITTPAEARLFAQVVFYRLDGGRDGVITLQTWTAMFRKFNAGAYAWSVMFGHLRQNLKGIDEQTFCDTIAALFSKRSDLSSTLRDFQSIAGAVKVIVATVFWIIMIFFLLLAAGVSLSKVIATFATLLVSGAVAFGNALKTLIESLVFILSTKPYDVGDRIALRDPLAAPLTVQGIRVMSTTFVGLDNRVVIMQNASLIGTPIYNLRRSKNANVEVVFEIGFDTTPEQLKALKEKVCEFLEKHRSTKARFDFYVKEVDKLNSLFLHIWFQTVFSWHEGFPVNYVRSDVVQFTQAEMNNLGIKWKAPKLPVEVAGEMIKV
eukprot:TRINITY_DN458_c0_g1_i1.p1 TRINITY_DN458_c0_g1~~TRINITY_DN458_c0_g1_i1.p1  ORF type:complete len:748 (-),score=181.08 TRINITY_DN458_c0_g1_i1:64-2307(-)